MGYSPEYVKETWGVDGSSINKVIDNTYFDWFTPDVTYVA
jgi:hypothetical protein